MKKIFMLMCLLACALFLNSCNQDEFIFNEMLGMARKGDPVAQYQLAMMYNSGIGTEQNSQEAFRWFKIASASGDALAAFRLGCYFDGQGDVVSPPDREKAFLHYQQSARSGYSHGQIAAAKHLIDKGEIAQGLAYLDMAARQGEAAAFFMLAMLHADGKAGQADLELAYMEARLASRLSEDAGGLKARAQALADRLREKLDGASIGRADLRVERWAPSVSLVTERAKLGFSVAKAMAVGLKL